jgi:hypothetical protein
MYNQQLNQWEAVYFHVYRYTQIINFFKWKLNILIPMSIFYSPLSSLAIFLNQKFRIVLSESEPTGITSPVPQPRLSKHANKKFY